jgi:hypothetical protein
MLLICTSDVNGTIHGHRSGDIEALVGKSQNLALSLPFC